MSGFVKALLALEMLALVLPGNALATTRSLGFAPQPGVAVSQSFRPDGASVVLTAEDEICLVSRRIDIETSSYVDSDDLPVPFFDVRRSPAASIQAFGGSEGAIRYRVQLKYSPKPGQPIELALGDGGGIDATGMLEPSTDSLLISGAAAEALTAAFAADLPVLLRSVSRDTDRRVSDSLPAPDLAALADCRGGLAATQRRPFAASTEIRVAFQADPETSPLATLDELKACGMTDQPGEFRLARLLHVTGFVSQTDKVFVTFGSDGRISQAYIPGIFDADFRNGARRVRVSVAADANVPAAENRVTGCLGSQAVELCSYREGSTVHSIAACPEILTAEDLLAPSGVGPARAPLVVADLIPPGSGGGGPGGFGGGGGGGGGGGTPGGVILPGGDPDDPTDPETPPGDCVIDCQPDSPHLPSVPLPMPAVLLLAALMGLGVLGRRRF